MSPDFPWAKSHASSKLSLASGQVSRWGSLSSGAVNPHCYLCTWIASGSSSKISHKYSDTFPRRSRRPQNRARNCYINFCICWLCSPSPDTNQCFPAFAFWRTFEWSLPLFLACEIEIKETYVLSQKPLKGFPEDSDTEGLHWRNESERQGYRVGQSEVVLTDLWPGISQGLNSREWVWVQQLSGVRQNYRSWLGGDMQRSFCLLDHTPSQSLKSSIKHLQLYPFNFNLSLLSFSIANENNNIPLISRAVLQKQNCQHSWNIHLFIPRIRNVE